MDIGRSGKSKPVRAGNGIPEYDLVRGVERGRGDRHRASAPFVSDVVRVERTTSGLVGRHPVSWHTRLYCSACIPYVASFISTPLRIPWLVPTMNLSNVRFEVGRSCPPDRFPSRSQIAGGMNGTRPAGCYLEFAIWAVRIFRTGDMDGNHIDATDSGEEMFPRDHNLECYRFTALFLLFCAPHPPAALIPVPDTKHNFFVFFRSFSGPTDFLGAGIAVESGDVGETWEGLDHDRVWFRLGAIRASVASSGGGSTLAPMALSISFTQASGVSRWEGVV